MLDSNCGEWCILSGNGTTGEGGGLGGIKCRVIPPVQACLITYTLLCDRLEVSAIVSLYSFTMLMPLTTGETTESTVHGL